MAKVERVERKQELTVKALKIVIKKLLLTLLEDFGACGIQMIEYTKTGI